MEKFNKRIFGNLSNKIAIIKKIVNQPKKIVSSEETSLDEEIFIEESIIENATPIEEIVEEREEIITSEEKPKKGRKKKSE
jgi:hypothetical protein